MPPLGLTNLLKRRDIISRKVTTIAEEIDERGDEPWTISQLEHSIAKLTTLLKDNESIHDQISMVQPDESVEVNQTQFATLDRSLSKMKTDLEEIFRTLRVPDAQPNPPVVNNVSIPGFPNPSSSLALADVRLPQLDIPSFSGDIRDWESFQDLFNSVVKENPNLSEVRKLQFLKSKLGPDPLNSIDHIKVTSGNFDEAWKILASRYENKRQVLKANLDSLFRLPFATHGNPEGLRSLIDSTKKVIQALKGQNQKVEHWDSVIIHLLCRRIDSETLKLWENTIDNNHLPTYNEFIEFLEKRARVLLVLNSSRPEKSQSNSNTTAKPWNNRGNTGATNNNGSNKRKGASFHHLSKKTSKKSCPKCKENHFLAHCSTFKQLSVQERNDFVTKNSLCQVCLNTHSNSVCNKDWKCKQCNGPHHSLLHLEKAQRSQINAAMNFANDNSGKCILLATAIANVHDVNGDMQKCRIFLDQGSEISCISENCMERLGLKRSKGEVSLSGVGLTSLGRSRGSTTLKIFSCVQNFSFAADVIVLSKVTGLLPSKKCDPSNWSHIEGLPLADPQCFVPSTVDILLGADYVAWIMREGRKVGISGSPIAQETALGWILSGQIFNGSREFRIHACNTDLDSSLQKFWEIEEIPNKMSHLSLEDQECEKQFLDTYQRDETGRFVVKLPLKDPNPQFGSSKEMALKRWYSVERRLSRDKFLYEQYQACLQEYFDLGHMELVPEAELENENAFYIPHHAVIKESSTTTKCRVVFDASAKSSNGKSLNDWVLKGPRLQDDLTTLLMRFRIHQEPLVADIEKMYRQFLIHPSHRDFQRILWRPNPESPVLIYRLRTNTFGVACAPYLAIKCVQTLAMEEKERFPMAAPALMHDLYVDNLLSGKPSVKEGLLLQSEICQVMNNGGMVMRQWSAANPKLLESLPIELRETQAPLDFNVDDTVKTLGIQWHPASDHFSFKIKLEQFSVMEISKRKLLSEIATLFDPLGWLSPITIKIKMLMQATWKINLGWDEAVPTEIQDCWETYKKELQIIESFRIPRGIVSRHPKRLELHGYCDASNSAYAAVVYLREITVEGLVRVSLIVAKTKVAPVKVQSIPRLELCGAVLLANLLKSSLDALALKIDATFAWCDSTITLCWIKGDPNRWKTFVSNRVAEIQSLSPPSCWHHVAGVDNPADVASRGISPSELDSHPLWWQGPKSLWESTLPISNSEFSESEEVLKEEKQISKSISHVSPDEPSIFDRFSSLTKLIRVCAWIRRFRHNAGAKNKRVSGSLTSGELQSTLLSLIKIVQRSFFDEIGKISKALPISSKSKIANLAPEIHEGIVRVGGRLRNAPFPESLKHPILLPRNHKFTELIVSYFHKVNLHAGPQLLMATIRQQYWILGLNYLVRRCVKRCVTCTRIKASLGKQMMADFPSSRVSPGRAFDRVGVDFAGPFSILNRKGKGAKSTKGYIVLFVCFVTRAIHIELASDLSSGSFLGALKRFVSRRGKPSHIYSDNGRNLVKVNKELKNVIKSLLNWDENDVMHRYVTECQITWHFNPPSAPHFGGLWEAGIKSAKFHLKRVLGTSRLTMEEMSTLLCLIEACLNSRPMTEMSSDPNDYSALTPGHFLIGGPLNAIPERNLITANLSRLSRWQLVTRMFQHFWKRWTGEYLTRLQQRPKWLGPSPNIKVGDIVLIKDDNQPPLKWNLARITALHPGADEKIRVVTVKTAYSEYQRPIHKLCLLPISN